MQPKREPTLKELMARQGKLSSSAKLTPSEKPQRQQPKPPQRTDAEKQKEAAKLAEVFNQQMNNAKPTGASKEDKIRQMVEHDPEKTAALLRQMFLK